MKIKKGDFVELDYVGRLQEDGRIFDLTSQDVAKKEGLYREHQQYGPRVICVGEGQIVKGIDTYLEGKDMGKYTLSLGPDEAFGKKNAKLMKIVPIQVFMKQQIKPFPGLQVTMDGFMGVIKTVSGGRVIVDFNHPLAGRDVTYELTAKRIVTDSQEKIHAFLRSLLGQEISFAYAQGNLTVHLALPEPLQKQVTEHLTRLIPEVKHVTFIENTEEKTPEQTPQEKATTPP